MLTKLRHAVWRHERRLIVVYLAGLVGVVLALTIAPVRTAILDKAEAGAMRWDRRWLARVDKGERHARAGNHRQAVDYLAALDREFPASFVKHRYDKERRRILRALGDSYIALGDSAAALGTFRRLVAFDPRDYLSHVQLATAASRFGATAEAETHWRAALAINPVHLPSLRALVTTLAATQRLPEVATVFDPYAGAFLLQHVRVRLGDTTAIVDIPVDGRWHDVELALTRPVGWSGSVVVDAGGFAMELAEVALASPLRVGDTGAEPFVLRPPSRIFATDSTQAVNSVELTLSAQPAGIARLGFRVMIRKPVDAELWAIAERAYRAHGGAERAMAVRSRLFVHRDAATADKATVDVSL